MKEYKKRRGQHILLAVVLIGSFIWSLSILPPHDELIHPGGLVLMKKLILSVFDMEITKESIQTCLEALLQTFVYASASMGLSVIIGLVFGLLSSKVVFSGKAGSVVRTVFRIFSGALRGIHELIWAWIFVAAIGLTPLAGVFALAIPYGGFLAVNYCNNFNSTPKAPLDALRRSGANRGQIILYGVLPQAFPEMVSFTMTNYECCLRSSTIMSFVGLGGIGYQIQIALKDMKFNLVWLNVIALILLVMVIDVWGIALRKRIVE